MEFRQLGVTCQGIHLRFITGEQSVPFVDELVSHLKTRFSNLQEKAIMGMTSVMVDTTTSPSTVADLMEQYVTVHTYGEDLQNPSVLETEIHLWKCKWNSSSHQLPDTPAAALNFASHSMFPNIHQIFCLVCIVPVTSCACERSVSVLRRLKTYLRSNMDQERLSGLALMHIHYNMELNLEEIVDNFARKHPRRIMPTNILEQTGTMPN